MFGPFAEDQVTFEVLYDNPYFVAAGAKNPWTCRQHVELAKLIDEFRVLPPSGTRSGSIVRDIFDSKGLPCPRASVVSHDLEMTINLLRTGRYLAIHAESMLGFPPQTSAHQEIAGRIAERHWARWNTHVEGSRAQPSGTTVHRLRP